MGQPSNGKAKDHFARHIASAGMALALCLVSLMLFRGLFSLLQALIIPVIIILLTERQPQAFPLSVGISLLFLAIVFFPTQAIFVMIYLLMAFVLQRLIRMMNKNPRLRTLLFLSYLSFIGLLLFLGLIMTDFVFLTQLHAMMLRLSGNNPLLYVGIIMLESTLVSGFHLLFILFFRRRLLKVIEQTTT